jgi:membrane protease YdiL (CAAX protease family)
VARRAAPYLALPQGLLTLARVVGACLAYLAILDLTVLAAYAIGQTVVPDAARGTFGLLGLGVAEAAALVAVLLFWRRVDRRRLAALGLEWQAHPWRRWLRGALIAGLMMGFIVLVGYTLVDGAGWDFNSDALRAGLALIGGLLGFAVQGPAEEVLFRGYILQNVREQWGVGAALVVSSLAFSLLHLSNPAYGVVPFINLVLFGLGTALYRLYVDADQLWGIFAIHSVWNWLQQVVFGLPNSGITSLADNTLFRVTPDASLPGVLSGGGFGPEGTIFATLVLLALIGGCLRERATQPPTAPLSPQQAEPLRSSAAGRRRR